MMIANENKFFPTRYELYLTFRVDALMIDNVPPEKRFVFAVQLDIECIYAGGYHNYCGALFGSIQSKCWLSVFIADVLIKCIY